MKLHEDRYAFLTIINLIHDVSGIRSDILEKDYYVSLLLRELAEKQSQLPAYSTSGRVRWVIPSVWTVSG